jgi:hypothetical protein
MTKTWRMLAAVVPFALVVACTDAAKAPAEAAMAAAATAVDSLKGEAVKFAPDAVKGVEATYASAKDLIGKQDYKGALAAAQGIPAQAKEALAKAAANKQVLVNAWNEAGGSVTKMLDAAKSRLDILAQSKKLPAGMDKATLEKAQSGYSSIQSGLAAATEQFKAGDYAGAMSKASALKAQGLELLKSIGLQ